MKKYYFVSDIHSFYTPLITSLHKKGFDENNPNDVLVVLGDVFDRGFETLEVYNFLKSFPEDRLILIRGNHELLYIGLLSLHFPTIYDFKNGTVRTFCQIANIDEQYLDSTYWFTRAIEEASRTKEDICTIYDTKYSDMPIKYWNKIVDKVLNSEITKWIQSDRWIDHLETTNYICVHSWIPCETRVVYNNQEGRFEIEDIGYRDDWRNATQAEWEDATWGCPWKKAKLGWNKTNKIIMCGHWHTSEFFNNLTKQRKGKYECPIFNSKKYKLIGLDACTAMSNRVNVLVLNEDEL